MMTAEGLLLLVFWALATTLIVDVERTVWRSFCAVLVFVRALDEEARQFAEYRDLAEKLAAELAQVWDLHDDIEDALRRIGDGLARGDVAGAQRECERLYEEFTGQALPTLPAQLRRAA